MSQMKVMLYDPRTNVGQVMSYKKLSGITGRSVASLQSNKCRGSRIKDIGCYILDTDVSHKTRYELYSKITYSDEAWKMIDGSKGVYEISTYGRVKKHYKNTTRFLLPFIKYRYGKARGLIVKLKLNGKYKETFVRTLVADHFVPNPKKMPVSYCKNGDLFDLHVSNIAFASREELGRKTGYMSRSMPVQKIDPVTGEVVDEYKSVREAGRNEYLSGGEGIRNCIHGNQETAAGYKWQRVV